MNVMKNIDRGKIDLRFFALLFIISGAELFEFNFDESIYGLLFLFSIAVIGIELIWRLIRKIILYRDGTILKVVEDTDRYLSDE
jgi:hypothetical protein